MSFRPDKGTIARPATKKRRRLLVPLLLILFSAGCDTGLSACSEAVPSISPRISFTSDERTVAVKYGDYKLTIPRPLATAWAYKAPGRVHWVATNGNDQAPGTRERPLRTIGKAIARVNAGDIIYIRAGTYEEALQVSQSGTPGRPIILSCAPEALGKVKITPPNEFVRAKPHGAVITVQGAHHVWINGLVLEGPRGRLEAPTSETYGANGITWSGGAGIGCRATNNVVYWNVHCGLKEMSHGGRDIVMQGNVIFANGTEARDHGIYAPADGVAMLGNVIFDNAGFGIHSYSHPRGQKIERNLVFKNKGGGIILAGPENQVLHNTVAYNDSGIFYFRGGCTNNICRNNIAAFNRDDCAYDNGGGKPGYGDPAGNVDDYNCYCPGLPDRRLSPGAHEILKNPRFLNAAKGDFRLAPDSPCRRAASGTSAHSTMPASLGAFE